MLRSLFRMSSSTPIYDSILSSLSTTFPSALHISAVNESSGHNVPAGSETHFLVTVADASLGGLSRIKRHRAINTALKGELEGGVHALRIVAKSEEEWEKLNDEEKGEVGGKAPSCRGGDGSLPSKK